MRSLVRAAATVVATTSALLLSTTVPALAATGSVPAPGNTCPNPALATNATGWSIVRGGTGQRVAVTDHAAATHAARIGSTTVTNPSIGLPPQTVAANEQWEFAVDTRVDTGGRAATVRARVEVDWVNASNRVVAHVDGPFTAALPLGAAAPWTRVALRATAPAGAVRANVYAELSSSITRAAWSSTVCDYRRTTVTTPPPTTPPPTTPPPTTPPPTTPPPTTPPPTTDPSATTAAGRLGWGAPDPNWSDEFNYTGSPSTKWGVAGECWPGHNGNGRRCASRTTVNGSALVQTGLANGDSAWLQSRQSVKYGRWEARVRSANTAASNGRQYHPLLIVWPSSNRWPQDGEYDFLENSRPGAPCAEAFLHYPHPSSVAVQQVKATETNCGAPLSEWHNIAFEWTAAGLKGYIDGKEWYSLSGGAKAGTRSDIQTMPAGRLTIQLDNFHGSNMTPATYEVDWVRFYPVG